MRRVITHSSATIDGTLYGTHLKARHVCGSSANVVTGVEVGHDRVAVQRRDKDVEEGVNECVWGCTDLLEQVESIFRTSMS